MGAARNRGTKVASNDQLGAWLPIETAPKSVRIIGFCPSIGYSMPVVIQCVFADDEWWPDCWEYSGDAISPTHWMPLPAPPQSA